MGTPKWLDYHIVSLATSEMKPADMMIFIYMVDSQQLSTFRK